MENPSELTDNERFQFLVLMGFTFIMNLFLMLFRDSLPDINQGFAPGKAVLEVDSVDSQGRLWASPIHEAGPYSPSKVTLNDSPFEGLVACPGIGTATARLIIAERARRPFRSWQDVHDRIKGLGPAKEAALVEAGVEISRPAKSK